MGGGTRGNRGEFMRCRREGAFCYECPLEGLECFPFQAAVRPSAGVGGVSPADDMGERREGNGPISTGGAGVSPAKEERGKRWWWTSTARRFLKSGSGRFFGRMCEPREKVVG